MNFDDLLAEPAPVLLSAAQLLDIHQTLCVVLSGTPFVIAGGAARDAFFGRPVKDIDVWLPRGAFEDYRLDARLSLHGIECETVMGPEAAEYFEGSEVLGVYEASIPRISVPVQFIEIDLSEANLTPRNVMDRMDIHLCRCFVCPGYGPVATLGALTDYTTRAFTVARCRDEQDKARTIRRVERLSEKYKGFRTVWAEGANV